MASTIVTKNSSTASAVPVTGDLTQGELAVNVTDKKLYTKDSGGTVVKLVGGLGNQEANAVAITGGSINGTTVGATTASTGAFTTLTASSTTTLSGGTANGVAYLNGSKVVTTGSALTFDGNRLTVSSTTPSIRLDDTNATGAFGIDWYFSGAGGLTRANISLDGSSGEMQFQAGASGSSGWYQTFVLSGSEQMRLTSTGLGIGTSSPDLSGASKGLTVNGTVSSALEVAVGGSLKGGVIADASAVYFSTRAAIPAVFEINGSEKMRLDSSGNLGLGVTPSAWSVLKAVQLPGGSIAGLDSSGNRQINIVGNSYFDGSNFRYIGTDPASRYAQNSGVHYWYNAPSGTAGNAITFTQAMTLDASGNLLVGTTSQLDSGSICLQKSGASSNGIVIKDTNAGGGNQLKFLNSSGTTVGYINQDGSTTSYSTSSDYRLKNSVTPMTGALARVAALKPVTYKWNADGSDGEGFIAHELAEVVPQCVTGEKDAVGAEGNPVYQGIDTSFLVATLTAAIQEQQAIIEQLKADVAALKGN